MALPIFGAQAAVSMVNRALSNSSPAHNVYLNQVTNAGVTAASEYAFAAQLGASYAVGKTPAELAVMVLENVGITATTINVESYNILLAAGTDYIAFHGTQNIGIIALQFGQIISGLEGDVTFGNAAKAWNAEVLAAYNYSTNPANGTTQTGEGVPGNSNIILTVGQDVLSGSGADDTFKANVSQNALGQQVNTLGSGDILEGGAGFDTLDAKITNGSFVGGSISQPIQPETNSIEYIKLQAVLADVGTGKDQVYVSAKDMIGVKTISSNYSDASLTVVDLTTKGSSQLSDLTVNMSYTNNNNTVRSESDFTVLFDQDYLTPEQTLGTASIDFLAMNEDNYDASNAENPLTGVFFRTLNFTLNGQEFNLAAYLGEDPAGAGDEINTYEDFLAAVQAGLVALKADHPENAALQSVTASFGRTFTTDISPTTLELREGTAIRLTADGQTNGTANTLYVDSTDLEVARAGMATVPNNNRYEIADATPPLEGSKLAINVELEKVGLAGDGGALVIGSSNEDGSNEWEATNTTVAKTTNGIHEFNVTVKGNADKSSSLSELRSTNNQLQTVTVKTDAAQTGTFANLTIGNSNTNYEVDGGYEHALKDVKIFDASGFKGDLSLQAALTGEVTAKYLDLKDKAPAEAAADNAAFIYTGGTGNDTIDLQVSSLNLAKPGTATREDFSVNIVGGAGNDEIILTVVDDKSAALDNGDDGAANWYNNQKLNANLRINAGDGNDIIRTPGSGDVIIDAGAGDDTVYADNTGDKAVWVLNAVSGEANVNVNDIRSSANDSYQLYKSSVNVSFKGFEATAAIADVRGIATDLTINQAIKLAINDNPTLNKLLVAEDGPANTLVITSLIDGEPVDVTDLTVALSNATLTGPELATAAGWYGVADGAVQALINGAVTNFNDPLATTYVQQLGNTDGTIATNLTGSTSDHVADHTITGGLGNDVLVLGTGAFSNETLVYQAGQFGNDKIVNFTTAVVDADSADLLDFTAWLNNTVTVAPGLATRIDTEVVGAGAIGANDVAVVTFGDLGIVAPGVTYANMTDAQVLAGLKAAGGITVAANTVDGNVQHSLLFVANATNAGEYKVYEVTSDNVAGDNFTAATLVGTLDFGATVAFTDAEFV